MGTGEADCFKFMYVDLKVSGNNCHYYLPSSAERAT